MGRSRELELLALLGPGQRRDIRVADILLPLFVRDFPNEAQIVGQQRRSRCRRRLKQRM